MISPLSRRRFISISASTLAVGLIPGTAPMAQMQSVRWQGIAMGAHAELTLIHPNRKQAEKALQLIQNEIRRLETVFSLYDQSSALSRLNRSGVLDAPPLDLIRCLDDARKISQITAGAFDVTVQPLWDLYARHFSADQKEGNGPSPLELKRATALVDYKSVQFSPQQISFAKPGMAVTLNGIAQGYITDRVTERLKEHGFLNVLIDLGETRGLGLREDASPWQVGIKDPDKPDRLFRKIALNDKALATSGGYGTRFGSTDQHHHLFDPKSGRSATGWKSISVIADDATRADALSTAFYSMPKPIIRQIAKDLNISVIAHDGTNTSLINS